MNSVSTVAAIVLFVTGAASALAAPGPQAACQGLADRAREAVVHKKQGLAVDQAIKVMSTGSVPVGVPPDQHDFYNAALPSVVRFAYMAGLSGDGVAKFYLKQCLQGS